MNQTYVTTAIILKSTPFRERDSRVLAYSREQGLLPLVARGTISPKSKLAPFIEPIVETKLLVSKGKIFNYLSSAKEINSYLEIKSDYDKVTIATQAARIFFRHVKEGEADQGLYKLLTDFFDLIEENEIKEDEIEIYKNFFILKLMCELGFRPELYYCVKSAKKIQANQHYFDYKNGGLRSTRGQHTLTISTDSIKILRLIVSNNFNGLLKIKITSSQIRELENIIKKCFEYNLL